MSFFVENFLTFKELNALNHYGISYTYEKLYNKILTTKEKLQSQIPPQSVVAILGDYSFENIALFFALYENKNIIVPITSQVKTVQESYMKESFTNHVAYFEGSNLTILDIENSANHGMLQTLQEKNQSGLILFSSGSTGKPKAMIHNLDMLIDSYRGKRVKAMNMLVFLMFDHIGGLNTLFNALSIGSCLVIPTNKEPKTICKLIEKHKIIVLPSSPTFLNLMLISSEHKNYDLSSLRMITYGTETMPQSLLKKVKEQFPRVKFLQTFGTSETGIAATSSKSSDSLYMKLNDENSEYKIVENELWLKSKTQVLGYLNASMGSFTQDGWFKTGDLVEELEDGYVKIIGRSKEVINVGGEKVLPAEVESILLEMTEIDDCMVYGMSNAITGQTVVCDVVLSMACENIKKVIRLFCKDKIDNFKIPTKVNVVEKTNFSDRFKKMRIR